MSWFLACPLAHLLYSLRCVQQKSQAASNKNTRQKILRPQIFCSYIFLEQIKKGRKKRKMKRKQAASQLVLIIGSVIRISIKVGFKFLLRNPGPPQSCFCVSPCIHCKFLTNSKRIQNCFINLEP